MIVGGDAGRNHLEHDRALVIDCGLGHGAELALDSEERMVDQSRANLTRNSASERLDSGHPDRCLVGISLILLCRAWSKPDAQVVVL